MNLTHQAVAAGEGHSGRRLAAHRASKVTEVLPGATKRDTAQVVALGTRLNQHGGRGDMCVGLQFQQVRGSVKVQHVVDSLILQVTLNYNKKSDSCTNYMQ